MMMLLRSSGRMSPPSSAGAGWAPFQYPYSAMFLSDSAASRRDSLLATTAFNPEASTT